MNKITLEACALTLSIYGSSDMVDLIRAAQKVVDATETYYTRYAQDEAEEDMGYTRMHLDAAALREALAEFRKREEGE
jgi:hypothetical protein